MKGGVIALGFIAAACQSPTQLVVLVDSDYQVPAELAAVQTIVLAADGETVGAEFFDLSRYGVPMSFGIEGGDLTGEQVRILIQGLTSRDELLVDRVAAVGFIEGEKRLLPIFLARSCTGVSCGENQTCTENGCASIVIAVESLQEIEPGDEQMFPRPKTDTGTGFPDAAPDGGEPDATGPDDGGPTVCTGSVECGGGEVCLEPNGADCTGSPGCECKLSCPPLSTETACPPGEECYYRLLDGVCLDRDLSTAANFRSPCTTGEDCDGFENFYCRQLGEPNPGECTSLCFENTYCDLRVPGTFCDLTAFGEQPYGECLEPPPPISDVGFPCATDQECQSGRCITQLGMCSSSCTGLIACPQPGLCAFSTDGIDAWCMRTCLDDIDCADNPSFVCRADVGFNPPGLCFFRCDPVMSPCAGGLVCDTLTGHCM